LPFSAKRAAPILRTIGRARDLQRPGACGWIEGAYPLLKHFAAPELKKELLGVGELSDIAPSRFMDQDIIDVPADRPRSPLKGIVMKPIGSVKRELDHMPPRLASDMVGELDLTRIPAQNLDVDFIVGNDPVSLREGERSRDEARVARRLETRLEIPIPKRLSGSELG
jgi:hypothetical protein